METDRVEYRDNQSLYVFSYKKESAFAGSVFLVMLIKNVIGVFSIHALLSIPCKLSIASFIIILYRLSGNCIKYKAKKTGSKINQKLGFTNENLYISNIDYFAKKMIYYS